VTILNTCDKLKDKNIFNYLAAERLKLAFRNWWKTAYPHETVPSYRTILRAGERLDEGEELTNSQQRALERALEYQQTRLGRAA